MPPGHQHTLGEKAKHAISHMLQCFATLLLPDQIKTDNGTYFVSRAFVDFLKTWIISHSTGIPYNPQIQAVMERYNQVLKSQLQKQRVNLYSHMINYKGHYSP